MAPKGHGRFALPCCQVFGARIPLGLERTGKCAVDYSPDTATCTCHCSQTGALKGIRRLHQIQSWPAHSPATCTPNRRARPACYSELHAPHPQHQLQIATPSSRDTHLKSYYRSSISVATSQPGITIPIVGPYQAPPGDTPRYTRCIPSCCSQSPLSADIAH